MSDVTLASSATSRSINKKHLGWWAGIQCQTSHWHCLRHPDPSVNSRSTLPHPVQRLKNPRTTSVTRIPSPRQSILGHPSPNPTIMVPTTGPLVDDRSHRPITPATHRRQTIPRHNRHGTKNTTAREFRLTPSHPPATHGGQAIPQPNHYGTDNRSAREFRLTPSHHPSNPSQAGHPPTPSSRSEA